MAFKRKYEVTCDFTDDGKGCASEGETMATSQANANVNLTRAGWGAYEVGQKTIHYCPRHIEFIRNSNPATNKP